MKAQALVTILALFAAMPALAQSPNARDAARLQCLEKLAKDIGNLDDETCKKDEPLGKCTRRLVKEATGLDDSQIDGLPCFQGGSPESLLEYMTLQAAKAEGKEFLEGYSCKEGESPEDCNQRYTRDLPAIEARYALLRQKCEYKTITECVSDLYDAAAATAEKAKAQDKSKTRSDVAAKMTATGDADSVATTSDSISDLLVALGLSGVSESGENVSIDFNTIKLKGGKIQISYGATVKNAEVFSPLVMAIPEMLRKEREADLKKEVDELDNIDFKIKLTLNNKYGKNHYMGRLPGTYTPILDAWYDQIVQAAGKDSKSTRLKLLRFMQAEGLQATDTVYAIQSASAQRKALDLADAAAKAVAKTQVEITKLKKKYSLADLIANQPQLIVQYTYKERDGPAGPDEDSFIVSYEMGKHNVNNFLKWSERNFDSTSPDSCNEVHGYPNVACLEGYMAAKFPGVKEGDIAKRVKKAPRLEIALEYANTDAFDFTVPLEDDRSLDFHLDDVEKWTGMATYGQVLRLNEKLEDQARFDFEAKYEDVSGDPMRQSRCVATLTYSENLFGLFTASLSAIYANKAEYRGDVDEEVSANFGIKWKLSRNESTEEKE